MRTHTWSLTTTVARIAGLRGSVWLGVRASAAAPGYFSPVCMQGKHYIDGGLVANNPTKIAIEQALSLLLPR